MSCVFPASINLTLLHKKLEAEQEFIVKRKKKKKKEAEEA